MPSGLTDPLSALSFSAMPLPELDRRHREMLARIRQLDHWRRLVAARLDLAVASVADLEEPGAQPLPGHPAAASSPLDGLRDLLGIARQEGRLGETALLLRLRTTLDEITRCRAELDELAAEAACALAVRSGLRRPA